MKSVLRDRALLTLMAGHFTNDMFAGVLPILYPIAKESFGLSNSAIGLLTLAYAGTASILQPVFGLVADRVVNRWLASAILLWSTCFVSLYGFAGSYRRLMLIAALAGIGSAAYHPFGAATAARVTDPRVRNTALSLYTVGGTAGYALGPILAVVLIGLFGPRGTAMLAIPGVLGAALLFSQMHLVVRLRRADDARVAVASPAPIPWFDLSRIVLVVMLRSWTFLAVLQFVPVWYDDLGYRRSFYGPLATVLILSGVIGTLVGGSLADRVNPRLVVALSQLLSIPALILFAGFPGPLAFLIGACFGFLSDASLSVTLAAAQRMLPGRTGIASGVILGLGFVTGGIGVPITGALADHVGISRALMSLSLLSALAAAVALWAPDRVYAAADLSAGPSPADVRHAGTGGSGE